MFEGVGLIISKPISIQIIAMLMLHNQIIFKSAMHSRCLDMEGLRQVLHRNGIRCDAKVGERVSNMKKFNWAKLKPLTFIDKGRHNAPILKTER